MKRNILFLAIVIIAISIGSFLITMSEFAQGVVNDAKAGKNNPSNVDSIFTLEEPEDTTQINNNTKTEIEFEYGYNAEISYTIAIPKNITEKSTHKYDSSIYYSDDENLIITKWTYKNLYPNIYNYPKIELGDIDINQIDTTSINVIFNQICDSLKTTLNNDFQSIKSTTKELILKKERKDSLEMYKLMLCNVVGGTHAITAISIQADTSYREIGTRVLLESNPK